MEHQIENERVLLRYLLGELDEREQEEVEERFFDDVGFFDQLLAVEDDLIDTYVRRDLSDADARRFEQHFLRSPDRRNRVAVAEIWLEYMARRSARSLPLPRREKRALRWSPVKAWALWVPLAAMLLLIIGVSWLLIDRGKLRSDLDRARDERDTIERERDELQHLLAEQDRLSRQPPQQVEEKTDTNIKSVKNQTRPPDSSPRIISFLLTPGFTREGAQGQSLNILAGTERVILQVRINEDGYEKYQAALKSVAGREVWNSVNARVKVTKAGKIISLGVPAAVLAEEDYILTLSGFAPSGAKEIIGEFPFSVLRK